MLYVLGGNRQAAYIIGGTSFFGGKGKVLGVVIGGLIIGSVSPDKLVNRRAGEK